MHSQTNHKYSGSCNTTSPIAFPMDVPRRHDLIGCGEVRTQLPPISVTRCVNKTGIGIRLIFARCNERTSGICTHWYGPSGLTQWMQLGWSRQRLFIKVVSVCVPSSIKSSEIDHNPLEHSDSLKRIKYHSCMLTEHKEKDITVIVAIGSLEAFFIVIISNTIGSLGNVITNLVDEVWKTHIRNQSYGWQALLVNNICVTTKASMMSRSAFSSLGSGSPEAGSRSRTQSRFPALSNYRMYHSDWKRANGSLAR